MSDSKPFLVLKFGGTSVASRERWEQIETEAKRVKNQGAIPVVVCSAISGVTNKLEQLLAVAVKGDPKAIVDELIEKHRAFARSLGVDPAVVVDDLLEKLSRYAAGAALTEEVSPRLRARTLALGELLSTRIGAAFMNARGTKTTWVDARDHLRAVETGLDAKSFLSATVSDEPDAAVRTAFAALGDGVILTQGFIARRHDGETALLGRGGSDTSAAYFAAKLGALRCEIWTDVPGVYTANPRDVPQARLLKNLDYDEAQEIATTGAKVLHPRCLMPARRQNIPMHIRCTQKPDAISTVITKDGGDDGARVKAISAKRGVTLIAMDTIGMWQQVGFLADAFAVFKQHNVSVDLVSTSEANVTCSIDALEQAMEPERIDALIRSLSAFCSARAIGPCAAVSLVGKNIRAILPTLGEALAVFHEKRIHLMSQAASDLNITFVIDEDDVDRITRELHAIFFTDHDATDALLGPTFGETFGEPDTDEFDAARKDAKRAPRETPWWKKKREELIEVARAGTPAYVYDLSVVEARAKALLAIKPVSRVLYAMKANNNADVLRRLATLGVSFECVSDGELAILREEVAGLEPSRILFTPNFAPIEEYARALALGVDVTLDNLDVLRRFPEVFRNKSVLLRFDPGRGDGHHHYVKTAGTQSKFGIAKDELEAARTLVRDLAMTVKGLHAHSGSGILSPDTWQKTARFLLEVQASFPDARVLDIGGGLGIVEKPDQVPLDLQRMESALADVKRARPDIELWIEPGRFLVAEAGVLLARVTQTKKKGRVRFVGVDAGMHNLIRPALYGAWHEIANLSRADDKRRETAHVVGPICESGDTLGYSRRLPPSEPGDVVAIATAGAYGQVMSSRYNARGPAREVALS
jgi:diaminopimelate decarboxylase/aspartate kinase